MPRTWRPARSGETPHARAGEPIPGRPGAVWEVDVVLGRREAAGPSATQEQGPCGRPIEVTADDRIAAGETRPDVSVSRSLTVTGPPAQPDHNGPGHSAEPVSVRPVRRFVSQGYLIRYSAAMTDTPRPAGPIKVGYCRCSTDAQDLTAQEQALEALGVDRTYVDHGLTGTNRERPGLREALAAVRQGDTFVVAKLDRLGRSVPDLRNIAGELEAKGVALQIGGAVHDPSDPVGRLLFNALAMVAEFEADIIRQRTREGMAVAKAKGRLKGKQPKLSAVQEAHLVRLVEAGEHTMAELAELFGVSRQTVYRALERARAAA